MESYGFDWAYRDVASRALYGSSERALGRVLAEADVLVNVSGVMVLGDDHLLIPVRVYLETDPVRPQIEVVQGRQFTIDFLAAHTHHFTYGENIGASDCGVPVERFDYRPTRPPVILDWWRTVSGPSIPAFTTIANWRQTSKDIDWNGRTLTWSKDAQFKRFAPLASRVRVPIELALSADDEDEAVETLRRAGWRVRRAGPLSKDIDAYRDYIRASAGEFTVAKEQNVALRSGWFSDRTASYLAAGRPAIVQDTGFGCALPTGEGLFAFSTLEEAVAAFEEVSAHYLRHRASALEIAQEHLSAETVLGPVIDHVSRCAC
jgi:hypothetical protein